MLAPHGLVDSFLDFGLPSKQQILLFDSLIYPRRHLDDQLMSREDFPVFEDLSARGIIRSLTLTDDDQTPWFGFNPDRDLWLREPPPAEQPSPMSMARSLRGLLLASASIDAVPIRRHTWDWHWDNHDTGDRSDGKQSPVVDVVLRNVPTPGDETPWEAILEFRDEPETRHRLVALRRWMFGFARQDRSAAETANEIEYLMEEYRSHIRHHRMKWGVGTVESIATLAGNALEGLLRFKPTQLVSALFAVRHRHVALLEAERSAPGRELAYLVDSQAKFPASP